jgi:hypothetical protein
MYDRKEFLLLAHNLENELKEIYETRKHSSDKSFKDMVNKYIKEVKDLQLKILADIERSE